MKKIIIIIGTRPEAIKTAILVKKIQEEYKEIFQYKLILTGQHDTMLNRVLDFFKIEPDYDLKVMTINQQLSELTAKIITSIDPILKRGRPDIVLVQGDTTTAFAGALVSFYNHIQIGHIEAGLRTFNKFQPFPEEVNRQLITNLADFHFAPTELNKNNLLAEKVEAKTIHVTGNTIVDALFVIKGKYSVTSNDKIVLITAHRRENFGAGIRNICDAIAELAIKLPDYQFVYPVHKNPNIHNVVYEKLNGYKNIKLQEPLDYINFIKLMMRCKMIITDSGGVQEEATTLGIPTIVLREITERPEGIDSNILKIIGTNKKMIIDTTLDLLKSNKLCNSSNVYGDGTASERILKILAKEL
jgi:UDP-N-acetylglucosamine 2-epimerase (non-hydrolysing)